MKKVMFCSPKEEITESFVGSEVITADCGHEVWISPASQQQMAGDDEFTTTCIPCASENPKYLESIQQIGIMIGPGQYQELVSEFGKERVDIVLAKKGVKVAELP